MKYAIPAALILGAAFLTGCGKDEIGDAPVVNVSAEQRAKDVNTEAEQTVTWLEGLPAADRQAAIARAPQIKSSLKEATDPAIKTRVAALGIKL
jgi:hypothetical protein